MVFTLKNTIFALKHYILKYPKSKQLWSKNILWKNNFEKIKVFLINRSRGERLKNVITCHPTPSEGGEPYPPSWLFSVISEVTVMKSIYLLIKEINCYIMTFFEIFEILFLVWAYMTFLVVFFKVCEFLYDVFENFENFAKKMSIYNVIYAHPTL